MHRQYMRHVIFSRDPVTMELFGLNQYGIGS